MCICLLLSLPLSFSVSGEELGKCTLIHINYLDKSKSSPLHLAVRGGNTEVIKLCIAKGAKVDQQQVKKHTHTHTHFFLLSLMCPVNAMPTPKCFFFSSILSTKHKVFLPEVQPNVPRRSKLSDIPILEKTFGLTDMHTTSCHLNTYLPGSCTFWSFYHPNISYNQPTNVTLQVNITHCSPSVVLNNILTPLQRVHQ